MVTAQEFAKKHLGHFNVKGNEIQSELCPFCKGGSHNDKYTFAINYEKNTYNCKRGSCGKTGTLYQILKEFGEIQESQVKKEYKKPVTKTISPTQQVRKYLESRGISKKTQDKYDITADEKGNLAFQYFENGELVALKFRNVTRKDFWCDAGAKSILWGIDNCKSCEQLIICEGEIDAMSVSESGFENAVSIPFGVKNIDWIQNCWEFLEQFKKIIIWSDNDTAGKEMLIDTVKRLGEWRCFWVNCKLKDANDLLVKEGVEAVRVCINTAQEFEVTGLLRLSKVKDFEYENIEKVSSGFANMDKILGGFIMGQITVWTGINGSGKSTFLGQILIDSIDNGYGVCAFSGELTASFFRHWIELQMAGLNNLDLRFDEMKNDYLPVLKAETSKLIREWYSDKFFIYDTLVSILDTDILKIFEIAVRKYNCKVFLVDNIMATSFTDKDQDFYRKQSNFVGRLKEFAIKYNVHVHIVAHPRKSQGWLNKMDISGSGDIVNRADNVISVHRLSEDDKQNEFKYAEYNTVIEIMKNRLFGTQDIKIPLKFDVMCKRFYQNSDVTGLHKMYGWEALKKDNWVQCEEKIF